MPNYSTSTAVADVFNNVTTALDKKKGSFGLVY